MKVSVNRFSHDCKRKSFTAEMSDLPREIGHFVTQGLTLVSDLGTEAHFYVTKIDRSDDMDNELVAWNLLPSAESIERNPRLKDYTLTIFND